MVVVGVKREVYLERGEGIRKMGEKKEIERKKEGRGARPVAVLRTRNVQQFERRSLRRGTGGWGEGGGLVSSLIRQRAGRPCIARGCRLGLDGSAFRPTGN